MAHDENARNSPLLSLPGEIRNKIYRLVLVSDPDWAITIKPAHMRRQRSLLKTCYQIREEASQIYYGENIFLTTSLNADLFHTTRFLRSPDQSIARMLSSLTLVHSLSQPQQYSVAKVLERLGVTIASYEHTMKHTRILATCFCDTAESMLNMLAKIGVPVEILTLDVHVPMLEGIVKSNVQRGTCEFKKLEVHVTRILFEEFKKKLYLVYGMDGKKKAVYLTWNGFGDC